MKRKLPFLFVSCLIAAPAAHAAATADTRAPRSIPVEAFFADADISSLQVSPSGKHVAFMTRLGTGRIGIALMNLATREVEPLVGPRDQNVDFFFWKGDDWIVFGGDYGGNESNSLRSIGLTQRKVEPLAESYRERYADRANWAEIVSHLHSSPEEILIFGNKEIGNYDFGFWRLNVRTGRRTPVEMIREHRNADSWKAGSDGTILARARYDQGRLHYEVRADRKSRYESVLEIGAEDSVWSYEFIAADDETLYLLSSDKTDTPALHTLNVRTRALSEPLLHLPDASITGLIASEDRKTLYGAIIEDSRIRYHWFDAGRARLQKQIDASLPHTFNSVVSSTTDEQFLVILAWSDRDPGTYYLFDRRVPSLSQFGKVRRHIDPNQMRPMEPIQFTSRDGIVIHGYLTRPAGYENRPAPMVLLPHGGPYGLRDSWGFDGEVQFLASRGYAVLQVNFRGSGGYGARFVGRGAKQWGGKMQDDLTDGVKWAIEQKFADPGRVAIFGSSYGGYAALAGVTFTPELYRCAINYLGVSDLKILKRWGGNSKHQGTASYLEHWIGTDPDYLRDHSPVHFVENIRVPTLHAYGYNDPRVDFDHWKRLKARLEKLRKPFEEVVAKEEGHGFDIQETRIAFYSRVESFLSQHMPADE